METFCDYCQKNLSTPSKFKQHMYLKHGEEVILGICHSRISELPSNNDEDAADRPFACQICGARYKNKRTLSAHRKLHSKESYCDICHKGFSSPSKFRDHMLFVHEVHVILNTYNKSNS
ncbi:unnamed protein product [Bemisia tabaci]|uniref:C2H2-type domain-containing protein n=1 Tax=Bemisia tabaci TaxID=7038 RepID=A0A9P0AEA4_BEMTA|nr:unnamed protein product [Bemisia tabaci]